MDGLELCDRLRPLRDAAADNAYMMGDERERGMYDGYGEVMLCGGAEAAITPLAMGGFTSMKALTQNPDPKRASIPFDAERSGFVLGAGAAELVARITVCLVLPGLFAGGAVSANAPAMAFYALCAADPMAWIAADTVLCIPFFRNILKKNYGYLRSGRA